MRCSRLGVIALTLFATNCALVRAQNTADILEKELKDAKVDNETASAQTIANYFGQVDAAMGSTDAAVNLYQQSGGGMPDLSPVITTHETESASEREARLALDQANINKLGLLLELHCGLLHYGALFVTSPKKDGLQQDFANWLAKAAQIYIQLGQVPEGTGGGGGGGGGGGAEGGEPAPRHHHREEGGGGGGAGANSGAPLVHRLSLNELRTKTLKDSLISKFLNFRAWGDSEQGGWSVKLIPNLYKTYVLDPLRKMPTANTLASWDVYIAMMNADERDNDRWNQVVNPPLQFERACDDYAITPSTEKLEGLIGLYKANPNLPGVSDWWDRIKKMVDDYKASHGGSLTGAPTAPAPSAPATNSNITVTTKQDGDMTVVTTHTNAPSGQH